METFLEIAINANLHLGYFEISPFLREMFLSQANIYDHNNFKILKENV